MNPLAKRMAAPAEVEFSIEVSAADMTPDAAAEVMRALMKAAGAHEPRMLSIVFTRDAVRVLATAPDKVEEGWHAKTRECLTSMVRDAVKTGGGGREEAQLEEASAEKADG